MQDVSLLEASGEVAKDRSYVDACLPATLVAGYMKMND